MGRSINTKQTQKSAKLKKKKILIIQSDKFRWWTFPDGDVEVYITVAYRMKSHGW